MSVTLRRVNDGDLMSATDLTSDPFGVLRPWLNGGLDPADLVTVDAPAFPRLEQVGFPTYRSRGQVGEVLGPVDIARRFGDTDTWGRPIYQTKDGFDQSGYQPIHSLRTRVFVERAARIIVRANLAWFAHAEGGGVSGDIIAAMGLFYSVQPTSGSPAVVTQFGGSERSVRLDEQNRSSFTGQLVIGLGATLPPPVEIDIAVQMYIVAGATFHSENIVKIGARSIVAEVYRDYTL